MGLFDDTPLKPLFDAFDDADRELYLVGGAVRDWALGANMEALDDFDFCTDARPETTLDILETNDFHTYELGGEFGTVGAVLFAPEDREDDETYPKDIQITTYRSDEYYRRGSRHPTVEFGDTIEEDLGRRDFSINSMALDADGQLIDPYDGHRDLEEGILRVIGDPVETLAEDPLRILRTGRFIARLAFEPHDDLLDACIRRADRLLEISRERWFQEMTKLLVADHPAQGIRFLVDVGALGIMLPEVVSLVDLHERGEPGERDDLHHKDVFEHTLQVLQQAPPDEALRWAALLHDIGKPWTRRVHDDDSITFYRHEAHGAMLFDGIRRRFTFDNDTGAEVQFLINHHGRAPQYTDDWSDAAIRRFVRDMDPYVESILAFARADLTTSIDEKRRAAIANLDELEQRIDKLERRRDLRPDLPSGIGNDIMEAFDLEPSPMVGELKDFVEERIMDGELENHRDSRYYVNYLTSNPPDFLSEALDDA